MGPSLCFLCTDSVLKSIGYESDMKSSAFDFLKLSSHCQQFGCYARLVIHLHKPEYTHSL